MNIRTDGPLRETKLTAAQRRVLDYVADIGRPPPKCHNRTLLDLREAGLIDGWRLMCRATAKGLIVLGRPR